MNSLFTVHAFYHTASTGAQEAAQSTRATHLGAQDRSRDLTGATNGDVPNPIPSRGNRAGKGLTRPGVSPCKRPGARRTRPRPWRSPLGSLVDPLGVPAPHADGYGRQRRPVQRRTLFSVRPVLQASKSEEVLQDHSESVNHQASLSDLHARAPVPSSYEHTALPSMRPIISDA